MCGLSPALSSTSLNGCQGLACSPVLWEGDSIAPMSTAPSAASRRTLIEAVAASTIGTTIEWYDFFVYGLAAALVFPALFFPESDPFTGRLLAFGTFTVGFVARPLGGVVFGA